MIKVAVDITAFARNPFGGIARVCAATVIELAKFSDFIVTAYWAKGRKPTLAPSVRIRRISLLNRLWMPSVDITHSLCHRKLPVRSRFHVYSVHDAWSLYPNRFQSAAFQHKLGDRLKGDIENADLVVTGSEWTKAELLRLGVVDAEFCRVIPDGVDCPQPVATSTDILDRYGLRHREYVLFVGRLEFRKNLPHIVAAVRKMPSLKLVCVGEPGYGYEDSAVPALAQIEPDRLTVISRIADVDLNALYSNALASLQPSWDEGFGLPVLEAMAHGCPVIASERGATREVGDGAAVLVDPASPEQTGSALERLLSDASWREQLVEAGCIRAREYTWSRYGETLAGLYRQLMSR